MELYGYATPDLMPSSVEVDDPDGGVLSVAVCAAPFLTGDHTEAELDEGVMTFIIVSDVLTGPDGEDVELDEQMAAQVKDILTDYGFHPFSADSGARDLLARIVASEWHGGQASAMYAFTSTGAIRADLRDEIDEGIEAAARDNDIDETWRLETLSSYVRAAGERGPQPGWSDLSW